MRHPNWKRLAPESGQHENDSPYELVSSRPLAEQPYPVRLDRLRDGETEFDYLYRPSGAAVHVLPVLQSGELLLVRQYRWPVRRWITELVAGGIEAGEEPLEAARRELREEVGGTADAFLPLPAFYSQPGVSAHLAYPLIATGVRLGASAPEAGEHIEPLALRPAEAYARLLAGDIESGPAALVLMQARGHLEGMGLL